MVTQTPRNVDIDEEGSVVNEPAKQETLQRSSSPEVEPAAVCEDIFCEMKTVEQAFSGARVREADPNIKGTMDTIRKNTAGTKSKYAGA